MNDSKELVFVIGEETHPLELNSSNYKDNLLQPQIDKALELIKSYFSDRHNSVDNTIMFEGNSDNRIISFWGDRGTGKSSCIYSLKKVLEEKYGELVYILKVVDPLFFDKDRNILEIVIGLMFNQLEYWEKTKSKDVKEYCKIQGLRKAFQLVKSNLQYMAGKSYEEDSELEDLEGLSSSMELFQSMRDLIDKFLCVADRKYLFIFIDDIDLNAIHAYNMTEQLRKYLVMDSVIVCIAGKYEQLLNAIKHTYFKQNEELLKYKQISISDISSMADAYLTKFVPIHSRIFMPVWDDYADKCLFIESKNKEKTHFESVKIAILTLIYQKTHYLFYNAKGQTSLIIPTNLREIRALILMLYNLPDYKCGINTANLPENRRTRETFLNYFYEVWITHLDTEGREFARKLILEKEPSIINKIVLNELKKKYELTVETVNPSVSKSDWKIIMKGTSLNYNISIGDISVVVDFVNNMKSDMETRLLLFFIKSYYSIRLTQYYDELVSSLFSKVVNNTQEEKPELRYNVLQGVSNLQQLIGGNFYTISGSQLIQPEQGPNYSREQGLLNGEKIEELLSDIVRSFHQEGEKLDQENIERLRLAEFLMLISSYYFYTKSSSLREESLFTYRERNEVYYTRTLAKAKNIFYDVTAPFFNLLDVKRTYDRFNSEIFNIALSTNLSLYQQMLKICYDEEESKVLEKYLKDDFEKVDKSVLKYIYLSSLTLRNMEIAADLYQNMISHRENNADVSWRAKLKFFYQCVYDYSIRTYSINCENKKIKLLPFKVIVDFLSCCSDECLDEYRQGLPKEYDDEYSFINRPEMTFSQLWDVIPDNMKKEGSREYYMNTFRPQSRRKYSRETLVQNIEEMIKNGELNNL